jgi:ESS family glutamate:Na+ symporter
MCGEFIGFMLGATANAMAGMRTPTERCGPAPRAFLGRAGPQQKT